MKEEKRVERWSLRAWAMMLVMPALIYFVAASMTGDMRLHMEGRGAANLMDLGFALGLFAARIGAIVMFFLGLLRCLFFSPRIDSPEWMVARSGKSARRSR